MPIVTTSQGVIAPSKFRIVCNTIKDSQGNDIDLDTTMIEVIFYDRNEADYHCIWNPFDGNKPETNNAFVDDDGKLNLVFEDYILHRGKLAYILHVRVEDSQYESGYCDSYTRKQDSGIMLD